MQDGKKTKAQLIEELAELRRRLAGQHPGENAREPEAALLRSGGAKAPLCLAQEYPGKTACRDSSLLPVTNENGRAESLVLCMVDRTRHKTARDELACESDKLTGILEAMQDGVYIIRSDYSIEYLNPVAVREFGPVDGKKCHEYFNALPQACDWCTNADTYDGRSTRSIWTCIRNGKTYDVFDTPIRNTDGSVSKLSILHDVTEHRAIQDALRLDEARLQALLELSRMTEATVEEVTAFALQQLVSLTGSESGFLGLLDDSGETFTLHAVAHSSGEECSVSDYPADVPIAEAGLWREAWRSRKPLIRNVFPSQPPGGCRLMEGHGPLTRAMSVPVFSGSRLVGIAAVANKDEDYDLSDLRQLTLLADGMWRFFDRRRSEESLKESEKRLRFLSSKLLSVWESERERLAQELHDRIGQTLAAVKFGVETCLNARGRNKANLMLLSLQGVIPLLQKAMREVRNIYMHLRPTILDDFGVLAAIGWLCREFEKLNPNVRIEQTIRLQEKDVAEPLKIVVFRIVQEALTNMERHSGAGRVWLTAARKRGEISLTIRDDGQGFDPRDIFAADDTERGLGLASMREQTRQSGGTFTVESSKGKGTLVRATWPVCCE